MINISNIISYLLNFNIEFSIHDSWVIDEGHYAYKDIILSIEDRNLQIVCRFFNNLEDIEYYIKNVEDCYKFYDIHEFHSYMLKIKA